MKKIKEIYLLNYFDESEFLKFNFDKFELDSLTDI